MRFNLFAPRPRPSPGPIPGFTHENAPAAVLSAEQQLLAERKLGYLALLRNLRNMDQAGVDEALVKDAILARNGVGYGRWVHVEGFSEAVLGFIREHEALASEVRHG